MKIRQAFVANSSSSSFIISKYHLSEFQIQNIYEHYNFVGNEYDIWDIEEKDNELILSSMMDNFDIKDYLINIVGIDEKYIKWSDY